MTQRQNCNQKNSLLGKGVIHMGSVRRSGKQIWQGEDSRRGPAEITHTIKLNTKKNAGTLDSQYKNKQTEKTEHTD